VTDFLQSNPDGQVLAVDEMSLYFQASTTRVWSPVGETPTVRVSGQREHVHFYGAINVRTGHELALPVAALDSHSTVTFLSDLLLAYPEQALLLLWDRATWHRGAAVNRLLEAHPRLQTLFFPPASPHLNPQEHVWAQAREAISHNHHFKHFSELKRAFLHFLSHHPFHFEWLAKYAPSILFTV
jgi:hypothetical protein